MKEAPFTKQEVEALNKHQKSGRFHPFTCGRSSEKCEANIEPRDYKKDGVLIATENGWICPCGDYTQNWAHKSMTE